jgi:hypothetical protein
MSSQKTFLTAFNNQFTEFLDAVYSIFPDSTQVAYTRNSLTMLRKVNPKLILSTWYQCIAIQYKDEINRGDASFFIEKNYQSDLSTYESGDKILKSIESLRDSIREMTTDDQATAMKYIQNLSKLSIMYHEV